MVFLREWNSFCFAFKNSTRELQMVINGDILFTDSVEGSVSITSELLDNLQIMRSADNHFQGFMGKLTQLNIWRSSLNTDFMISWTNCRNNQEGNLLKWESTTWKLEGNM